MNSTDPTVGAALVEEHEAVTHALMSIIDKVTVEIHVREIQRRACEKAASQCLEVAYDVIKLICPARQKAPFTPISMVHGSWEPEPNMIPCSVERWCGGFLGLQVSFSVCFSTRGFCTSFMSLQVKES
jgi:hypothetical protein